MAGWLDDRMKGWLSVWLDGRMTKRQGRMMTGWQDGRTRGWQGYRMTRWQEKQDFFRNPLFLSPCTVQLGSEQRTVTFYPYRYFDMVFDAFALVSARLSLLFRRGFRSCVFEAFALVSLRLSHLYLRGFRSCIFEAFALVSSPRPKSGPVEQGGCPRQTFLMLKPYIL